MSHSWCRDIPRDEAVRAAEDGRSGPLPTLEKVIAAVTDRRPVDAGGGENVTGLRTERVTLEVTHDLDAPLGDWIVQVIDAHRSRETVIRVVEETHFDDLAQVAMECDAAIREREEAKQRHARECEKCAALADKVIVLRARVAELESAAKLAPAANADGGSNHAAPQDAPVWLTEEEREALEWWCRKKGLVSLQQVDAWRESLCNLLARSSPPEVVHPAHRGAPEIRERDSWWRKALAAAGVTVKEAGK